MKKFLLSLMALGFMIMNAHAQVAGYTFSQATTTYTAITTGTVLGDTTTDEQRFLDPAVPLGSGTATTGVGLPIGFNFVYNGITFDRFAVDPNGWISLGQSALTPNPVDMTSTSYILPVSTASTAPAVLQNRISIFGRNLAAQTGAELRYSTTGTTPNQILVIQWKHYRRNTQTGENFNFQIRLHETTNVVEFVYGTVVLNANPATAPQVGLRGSANTDYNNRTSTTNWAATTAGAVNTATITISNTIVPASGLDFMWTPPITYQYDAGVTAINAPAGVIPAGSANVTVTIKNFGTQALTYADIAWSVNGVLQTPYVYSNAGLAQNATDGPIQIGTYNFTTAGNNTIMAWTEYPNTNNDQNNANDTSKINVYVQGYTPVPYSQNFDNTWINKTNTRDVPDQYWINNPATGNNSWRRDDDGVGAGWTGAGGAYTPAGANTTTHSARFHSSGNFGAVTGTFDLYLDFSAVGTKLLKFWQINTNGTDSLLVSLSTNGGTTFSSIQKINVNAAWTQYQINLGASVSPTVILRFVAKTTAGAPQTTDIGLDEVSITILIPNDAGVLSINAPGSPVYGNVPVTVTLEDYGIDSLKSAKIHWAVDSVVQTAYTYTNTTGIPPNGTDGPITIGTCNFVTGGSHTIVAWTTLPNGNPDGNHANDTATKNVYVQAYGPIPYHMSFDSTWINKLNTHDAPDQYWLNTPVTGNNSWRRDDDGATAGWANGGTYTAGPGANGTAHSARFHSSGAGAGNNGTLDLYVDFTQVGSKVLKFWQANTGGGDSLLVSMSTDGGSTFTSLQKINTNAAWTFYQVPLGASVSPTVVIRFFAKSAASQSDIGLDEVDISILTPNDAGVVSINAPTSPVFGNAPVAVTVENFGTNALTSATIDWTVDGVAQTSFAYTNSLGLATNSTDGPITIGNYSFTTGGFHKIVAWTTMPNGAADGDHLNDTAKLTVLVQPYASLPYLEDFEGTWINKYNTRDVPSLYWTNTPVTGNDSWRRDDDGASAAWTQPAGGPYAPTGANGTTHSARFHTWYAPSGNQGSMDVHLDFTPVGQKLLKFWYINPTGTDSLEVSMSSDSGANFVHLQTYMIDTAWTQYSINLGGSTSTGTVIRFQATSDYAQDDIGLDIVQVYLLVTNDVGAISILSPHGSTCGSTNDSVIAMISNYGTSSQSNIPVTAHITGPGGPVTLNGTYAGPLASNASGSLFLGTINTTVAGTYYIAVYTHLPTDNIYANDTAHKTIVTAPSLTVPHVEDFEGTTPLANWNTNFITGNGHGNTSYVMYANLSNFAPTGTATMNKTVGAVTAASVFGFYYRIISSQGLPNPVTLQNDSIFIYLSSDCGVTRDQVYLIDAATHTPTANMTHIELPLTAYVGMNVIPSIYAVRANNANYYLDFDNIAIYEPPVANAGPPQSICYLDTLNIVSAVATNNNSLVWTTAGDGSFVNNTLVNPQYLLGTNDIANGTVDLTLHVFGTFDTLTSVVTITITNTATANAGNDVTICQGTPTQLTASGGNTYVWNPTTGLSDPNIANPLASPTTQTTYTVLVTSSCGTATASVTVYVNQITKPNLGSDANICNNTFITLNAGSGYDTYLWHPSLFTGQYLVVDSTGIGLGLVHITVDVTKGACTASDTINITFIDCSGIAENSPAATINIYPNPTTGLTNVVMGGMNAQAEIAVYTLQGQMVYSGKTNGKANVQLDLSRLPVGIYMLRLFDEKTNVVTKMIKE